MWFSLSLSYNLNFISYFHLSKDCIFSVCYNFTLSDSVSFLHSRKKNSKKITYTLLKEKDERNLSIKWNRNDCANPFLYYHFASVIIFLWHITPMECFSTLLHRSGCLLGYSFESPLENAACLVAFHFVWLSEFQIDIIQHNVVPKHTHAAAYCSFLFFFLYKIRFW